MNFGFVKNRAPISFPFVYFYTFGLYLIDFKICIFAHTNNLSMKKHLTTSVYTFKDIIGYNYLYVDKTEYLYKMVSNPKGIYFLSRPRRFGKSLTLSTFKSIFQGEKELFKGLYIYDKPFDWKKYPIIHLSLNRMRAKTADELEENLIIAVDRIAKGYEIKLETKRSYQKFEELIFELSKIERVVVLIDEYDKPLLDNVNNKTERLEIKDTLKSFYSVIKANDEFLRFVFITGVSKFSKVSVFSELNNLDDLTMNSKYGTALGFTQEEVDKYFGKSIKNIAKKQGVAYKTLKTKLRNTYNGYRFSDENRTVYNPVSLTKFVMEEKIKHYWFETGTPAFLLELMKENDYNLMNLESLKLNAAAFSTYEIENLRVEPLLFQTGYLTIKKYTEEYNEYTLSYPNTEVKSAFLNYLTDFYTPLRKEEAPQYHNELIRAILQNDIAKFIRILKIFFANIEYDLHIDNEKYYQTIFYIVFTLLGIKISTEVKTNTGRIDAVIETDTHIYILEFKLFDTAKNALKQIEDKQYFERYLLSKKQIVLIGVGFDKNTRNIKDDYELKTKV
ncbi:MAG: hypothetical protein B6I20_03175 [Bacteroidetes bacterium 4572_117]|nr:MAG: hypothetical protein B6I20_03175 [Bacteroidetes bacterium 4572_117]